MNVEPHRIDLNADIGEGCESDSILICAVTSASIACGGHAGDHQTMLRALHMAREFDVVIGAHPGFVDREHFGRREQAMSAHEVKRLIISQVEALISLAFEPGMRVSYLKPHGALYNQAQRDPEIARGVVDAMIPLGLMVLGQPGSVLETLVNEAGLRFVSEGFLDRRYRPDGRLVARSEPDAILTDPSEIVDQALRLIEQGVETLCVHGDNPSAPETVEIVRKALESILPRFEFSPFCK